MNYPPIVIRIHAGEDGAVDWTVQPDKVSFRDALEVIGRVLPGTTVSAFEYEDEDGDRITVRSDEEMANMIDCYLGLMNECKATGGFLEPLALYPRVGKPPERRNIHGLKVQTRCSEPNTPTESPMATDPDSGSRRQQPKDIREILGGGHIADADLQYLQMLGSGNAGTVYKALHKPTKMIMAVKVIPLDITPEVQRQIISELEILYKCKSSVIITFYGAFFVEHRISMCTEFMDGGSLDKYGKIEEHILGRIAVSVLKSLQYLWSLRIMHRDVKPSNMLVNTHGQVKLCDFGVSVQLVNSIAKTVVGTSAYMAPERIKAEDYSIHSDVWSLGVSLFELAVGRFPFDSVHVQSSRAVKPLEVFASIVQGTPPSLPRGEFSDALIDFVGLCMQKDPLRRPSPEILMKHPYIVNHDDENTATVAQWVQERLAEILLKDEKLQQPSA